MLMSHFLEDLTSLRTTVAITETHLILSRSDVPVICQKRQTPPCILKFINVPIKTEVTLSKKVLARLLSDPIKMLFSMFRDFQNVTQTYQKIPAGFHFLTTTWETLRAEFMSLENFLLNGQEVEGLNVEELQAWSCDHFSGDPVPVPNHPLGEEPFPDIQTKPPLTQLQGISSGPVTGHDRACSSSSPHKEVGLPALTGFNSSSQFCIVCKLAQYPFQSCIQVIPEDDEEYRAKDGALWNPTSDSHQPDVTPFTITLCA
ncbi:hypothetical protein HGM15179_000422 [Zosterops borbonicus]|uniref:Uncharacterized protein n=1 Tax=Zosterops borbonicus TaxID=364589 RepID=A0A8K1GZD9_9PASS|nr:hypothetical protein HGM15179_000422 [Zosterops borbonicus]